MKSFKALKEEKEYLSRELADSCRDYIDLKYKYGELVSRYFIVKKELSNKMITLKEAASLEDASDKINDIIDNEMIKSAQLNFSFSSKEEK